MNMKSDTPSLSLFSYNLWLLYHLMIYLKLTLSSSTPDTVQHNIICKLSLSDYSYFNSLWIMTSINNILVLSLLGQCYCRSQ